MWFYGLLVATSLWSIARIASGARSRTVGADAEGYLGSLLSEQGRTADALPYLEDAVRRDPTSALNQAFLSVALAQAGRAEQARAAALAAMAQPLSRATSRVAGWWHSR
jgi:Flp pilus assembly protein TadD